MKASALLFQFSSLSISFQIFWYIDRLKFSTPLIIPGIVCILPHLGHCIGAHNAVARYSMFGATKRLPQSSQVKIVKPLSMELLFVYYFFRQNQCIRIKSICLALVAQSQKPNRVRNHCVSQFALCPYVCIFQHLDYQLLVH